MNLHLCTEDPCPLRDKECADMLKNGFTTSYTEEYMSSLSQQLRVALYKIDNATTDEERIINTTTVRNLLPHLLTEHEALQRKADGLAKAVQLMNVVDEKEKGNPFCEGIDCANKSWRIQRDAALSAYREATKPSDV